MSVTKANDPQSEEFLGRRDWTEVPLEEVRRSIASYSESPLGKMFRSKLFALWFARLFGARQCGRLTGRYLSRFLAEKRYNVLAVSRHLFKKDLEQIEHRTGIHFVVWRSAHLGRLINAWTPEVCQRQGRLFPEARYKQHYCWDRGMELLGALFAELRRKQPVPVAISANIDYWQEEPLRRYSSENGVRHLVLCRENMVIPELRDSVVDRLSGSAFRFEGQVAVFSAHMKDVFVESGACRPEQVFVTGAPRTDVWLDRRPPVKKECVTLLSFRTSKFSEMFIETFEAFRQFSRHNPGFTYVVKCKEGRGDRNWVLDQISDDPDSNIQALEDVDLRDLLEKSKVIIGLNSLSLAEALLTDATIVVPDWHGPEKDNRRLMMDSDDPSLRAEVSFPRDIKEFVRSLEGALRAPASTDRENRIDLVNRYLYFNPNETASERVARLIIGNPPTGPKN